MPHDRGGQGNRPSASSPRSGRACTTYQDKALRGLTCRRIQCDEVWAFCHAKENVPDQHRGEFGYEDVWTWVALDADSKLAVCWYLGKRDAGDAGQFIANLAGRLKHRIQLTTDGHSAHLDAVEGAFGYDVDYAMLIKLYGGPTKEEQRRYSPAKCLGTEVAVIEGNPDPTHLDQLRRAAEPYDADAHARVHPSDQRVLQEG